MLRGGHFNYLRNPNHAVDWSENLYKSDMRNAKGMMRPKGTKGMQKRGAISGLRNKDISLEGYLATEYLYLPEFLDEAGNPYPLFKEAPIAAYYILRLKSAAMDFFDFYQGTTFPDYRQPKYPHLLKYNTRLSGDRGRGFREMQEFESASGNVYRKATNVKGYGGANALVIMDANIGLKEDDPDIKEEINDLGDAGFNQKFLYEVVQSLETQYAIYYDIVKGIIKEKGLKSLDIPMFKPVYPIFEVDNASYNALDPLLHIDTLTKSTILIFKFTIGSQTFEDFTLTRNPQINQTHIRWIWTDAQAQQMKYIIDRTKDLLPKIKNDKGEFVPVAIDLAMRSDSPSMERAIARQVARPTTFSVDWRQNLKEDNWSAWTYNYAKTQDAPYNVPIEDRAAALVRLKEGDITSQLKILCSFFGLMKTDQELKTSLFGNLALRYDRNNKARKAIVTVLAGKYSQKAENFIQGVRKLVVAKLENKEPEINLDQLLRATITQTNDPAWEKRLVRVSDQESAAIIVNESIEIANKWLMDNVAAGFTKDLKQFSSDKQKVIQDTLEILGFDFFRFLDILGYTDRYYGFKLSIWDKNDDYDRMCNAVKEQLERKSLLDQEFARSYERELMVKRQADITQILKELTTKMLETLRSVIGFQSFTEGLQDFLLSNIYYTDETNQSSSTMAQFCTRNNLPLNVSYLPYKEREEKEEKKSQKKSTKPQKVGTIPWQKGAIRFALSADEFRQAKTYLDLYKTNKIVFTNCSIDVLIKAINTENSTILSVASACLGRKPQVSEDALKRLEEDLRTNVMRFSDDIKFVSTLYLYLENFAKVTADYCPIPKSWLDVHNFFGVDLSTIQTNEYSKYLDDQILGGLKSLLRNFTSPLTDIFGLAPVDTTNIRSQIDAEIETRQNSMKSDAYRTAAHYVSNFNLAISGAATEIAITVQNMTGWFTQNSAANEAAYKLLLLLYPSLSKITADFQLTWSAKFGLSPFLLGVFNSTTFRDFVENIPDVNAVHLKVDTKNVSDMQTMGLLYNDMVEEAIENLTHLYAEAKNITKADTEKKFQKLYDKSPYKYAHEDFTRTVYVLGAVEAYVKDVALVAYIQKKREEFNEAPPTINPYIQIQRFEANLEYEKSQILEYFSARENIDLSIFLQPFAPKTWTKLRDNLVISKMFSAMEDYLDKCQKEIDGLAKLLKEPTIQPDKIEEKIQRIDKLYLKVGIKLS